MAPALTKTMIDTPVHGGSNLPNPGKMLVTKEWVQDNGGGVQLSNTLPWEALQKFNVGAEVSHSTTGAIPAFLANQKSSGLIADFTYVTDTKLSINTSGNLVSQGSGTFTSLDTGTGSIDCGSIDSVGGITASAAVSFFDSSGVTPLTVQQKDRLRLH